MKRETFWGLDISKKTIDLTILESGSIIGQYVFDNSPHKIKMAISEYMAQLKLTWEMCVFCMENTGIYGYQLLNYLTANSKTVYVVNPLHMKKSMGLVRGKNDRVDAQRIARFISRNYSEMTTYVKPENSLEHLKILLSRRAQYVKNLSQIRLPTKELKGCVDKRLVKQLEKVDAPVLDAIKKVIKELDSQIHAIIQHCPKLNLLLKRICSVPGVGPILGVNLLVITNGFNRLFDPKCLASFAGVAPFEFSSGSSIRRKPRVSQMGDKNLKKLFHLAALSVIRYEGELQTYYRRKIKEGKAAMTVLNAIRNKIIHRVCAVVRLEKNYQKPLVLS